MTWFFSGRRARRFKPEAALVRYILRFLHEGGVPRTAELITINLLMDQAEREGYPLRREQYPREEVEKTLHWMLKQQLVAREKRIRRLSEAEKFWQGYPWRHPREWVYTPLVAEWDTLIDNLLS